MYRGYVVSDQACLCESRIDGLTARCLSWTVRARLITCEDNRLFRLASVNLSSTMSVSAKVKKQQHLTWSKNEIHTSSHLHLHN